MASWIRQNKWKAVFLSLGIVFVLGVGVTAAVCHVLVAQVDLPRIMAAHAEMKSLLPRIEEDLKILEATPPFPEWTREKNAEHFLSQHVSWDGAGLKPLESPSHSLLRELFQAYPNWQSKPEQLEALSEDPRIELIDTGWMDQLSEFDHWALSTRDVVRAPLAKAPQLNGIGRVGVAASLPIPNYGEFQEWAVVNLLKAHQKGQALSGFKTYRKAAALMHTSSTLIGNMMAVAMLKGEFRLAELTQVKDWALVPERAIHAYKALSWAWGGLVRIPWFEELPKELETHLKPQNALCAGVGESVMGLTAFEDFLEPRVAFEDDFSENLSRSREFQKRLQSVCGLEAYGGFLSRVPAEANPLFGHDYASVYNLASTDGDSRFLPINPTRIPYVRRAVGLGILTVAMPNYLGLYRKPM